MDELVYALLSFTVCACVCACVRMRQQFTLPEGEYLADLTNISDTTLTYFFPALLLCCNFDGPVWAVSKAAASESSDSDFVEQSVLLSDHSFWRPPSLQSRIVGSSPRVEKSISHCVIYHIFTLVEPGARSTAVWAHKQRGVCGTDKLRDEDRQRHRVASLWLVFSVCLQ